MSRRTQIIALGVLFVVLVIVLYFNFRPTEETASVAFTDERFTPANVDNPALRMDVLKRFLSLKYEGVHRNIFSATLPPPPVAALPKGPPINVVPSRPAGPPPLTVDARYFGFVSDTGGNHKRAFFAVNNGEDVIIASEGDTLMGRFRVIRLTATVADVEEVSSGRRTTLTLEEGPPNG